MALSDGNAYLYIYPRTLTNCVVTSSFNGENTGTSTPTDNGTCLYTSVGLLLSATSHTEITITADGCLPQTLGSDGALSNGDYTITMEPASGYRKLYAWEKADNSSIIIYTDTDTPTESSTTVINDGNGSIVYDSNGNEINFVIFYIPYDRAEPVIQISNTSGGSN